MTSTENPTTAVTTRTTVVPSRLVALGVPVVAIAVALVLGVLVAWLGLSSRALICSDLAMSPTIFGNDEVHANMVRYGLRLPVFGAVLSGTTPKRGDVVVVARPAQTQQHVVRRVIAIEGDTVRVYEDGSVDLQGKPLTVCAMGKFPANRDPNRVADGMEAFTEWMGHQSYVVLLGANHQKAPYCSDSPCVVPSGHVFVLGDNRMLHDDSRRWGFVATSLVTGLVTDARSHADLESRKVCLQQASAQGN